MRAADLELIRPLRLMSGVGEPALEKLTAAAYLQRFPARVEIIREGDPADFLHVVVEGLVELYGRHNGREAAITILRPEASFILAAVVTDGIYLNSARTVEASRIFMIPAETVRQVFREDRAFGWALLTEQATRYRSVVTDLRNHKLRLGAERLGAWVLNARHQAGGAAEFPLPFEKRTLAALLGMTAENLSRALAVLARYGLAMKGRTVRLDDPAALADYVKPSPLMDEWKR